MKALVLDEYKQLNYRDFSKPKIELNEVLIRVKACGICGSDVHGMDGSTGRRKPPIIMGHEASGVIEEVGAEVSGWKVGDRVTFDSTIYPLNDWYTRLGHYNLSDNRKVLGVSPGEYRKHGAFAEYITVPAHILYRIPDNVSFEQAAMVEPVGVAAHAVNLCINSLRKGGTAVLVGNLKPEVTIPLQKVVTTELSLLGSCAINGEYELVLDLLASGKISVDKMISAVAPLSEGASWFNRLYNKEPGLNKVILVP
jgi:threonine dehydrogenase-like Zn-dependent dehydrogenase